MGIVKKYFITFGQSHVHRVAGVMLDNDCIAEMNCPSEKFLGMALQDFFNGKYCMVYSEKELNSCIEMKFFPRGIIKIN